MLEYSEIIETQGVKVPFVPAIITPKIERPMRNSRYEGGECTTLRRVLRPGDRVLELGAGVGLISAVAAGVAGVEGVTSVEANPDLIPLIAETHRLNGVTTVDLRNGVVAAEDGGEIDFFLRADFWASSMEPDSRPYTRAVRLPRFGLGRLIEEARPTVIVCDIEGGELGLFDAADLSGVRQMVIELHPKVYGDEGLARITGVLAAKGLYLAEENRKGSTVQLFERREELPEVRMPTRSYRAWPIAAPRVFAATCMKDEGPFILEWLAWHKAIGITDIVVFTNDLSDGSGALLDYLQDRGELVHLPNPAVIMGSTAFQPVALAYAELMPQMRAADFFISLDVDEFINIRVGGGHLTDLFAATGAFDVLSINELNHGANGEEHYRRGWVKDIFPAHQTERPGHHKSRRGVKSIVRLSERVLKLRNHRPDLVPGEYPAIWLDGSGRFETSLAADAGENGRDCRDSYGLVALDHFALRSLGSYLAKMFRGDVVVAGKRVPRTYWRQRNRNEAQTSDFSRADAAARAYHRDRFESDPALMALHEATCAAHEARIAALLDEPEFIERRDWALKEAW